MTENKNMRLLFTIVLLFPLLIFSESKELVIPQTTESSKWGDTGDIFLIEELKIFDTISEQHSQKLLQSARKYFSDSIEVYRDTKEQVKKLETELSQTQHPEDRFEWQRKSRAEKEKKDLAKILSDGRIKSIAFIIKSMSEIGKIKNTEIIHSADFSKLKASIYREYIKHQFALKNYNQSMEFLEEYVKIDQESANDKEAHKLLTICYQKMMNYFSSKNRDDSSRKFHEKMNYHFLKYTELEHGKESKQYKNAVEKVSKDLY